MTEGYGEITTGDSTTLNGKTKEKKNIYISYINSERKRNIILLVKKTGLASKCF